MDILDNDYHHPFKGGNMRMAKFMDMCFSFLQWRCWKNNDVAKYNCSWIKKSCAFTILQLECHSKIALWLWDNKTWISLNLSKLPRKIFTAQLQRLGKISSNKISLCAFLLRLPHSSSQQQQISPLSWRLV